jgi:hypothetical protein
VGRCICPSVPKSSAAMQDTVGHHGKTNQLDVRRFVVRLSIKGVGGVGGWGGNAWGDALKLFFL